MTKQKSIFLIVIITLSFLLSLFFYLGFSYPIEGDAYQYKIIAQNLLYHRVYSLSEEAPYLPTTFREPGYPVFLAFLLWLFKGKSTAIYLTQIIIFVLTVILVYSLSSKILGEKMARWVALITALCPTLANYPSYLLSETLFTFLLVLFMDTVLKAAETNKTSWYVCSGFLLGLSALTKSITVLLFIPIAFSGLLYSGNINLFLKKYLKNFTILTLSFLVIIAPWFMRNYTKFGKFSLNLRFSSILWIRGSKLDYDFKDIKKEIAFSLSEYLGKRLYPEVEESNRFLLKEAIANGQKIKEWVNQGYNEAEIDYIQSKEALTKISQRPLKYLSQNLLECLKMSAFLYIPLLNEPHIIERFNHIKNGKFLISALRGVLRLLSYLVLFFGFFGFFGERKRWRQWIFIAALIIYVNLSYSFLFGWGRYSVPLIPFYFMFAVAGVNFIKNKLKVYKSFT